ncbi:MAG TPA: membrane protein insertase YidC [Candidatus Saccharimonadaceae bacterium]|jgi:YidC/Oxa1 family membrane protein insertase|nr:membrane protein insertase YidC [Candidatus Saccharimonadaceae bacterium]
MDRKTLIAVGACVVLLIAYPFVIRYFGLGRYLDRNRPATATAPRDTSANAPAPGAAAIGAGGTTGASPGAAPGASLGNAPFAAAGTAIGRTVEIDTPEYRARFSNVGARLLSVELKHYASARGVSGLEHQPIHVAHGAEVPAGDRVVLAGGPLVAMDLGSGATLRSLAGVAYAVEESADASGATRTLIFTSRDSSGLTLRQVWRARPGDYALDYDVSIDGVPSGAAWTDYSLTLRSWPLVTETNLLADERSLRAASMLGSDVHKDHAGGLLKAPKSYDGNVKWAAVTNRYFLASAAVLDGAARGVTGSAEHRTLTPDLIRALPAGARPEQDVAINTLRMALAGSTHHRFLVYVGPVEYVRLENLKVHLERAVDLGWSWVVPFSSFLLWVLNRLYAIVHNYGFAILLLATLVRVVLHPLNMTSMKSQRAMQKLQPEIERIREKYKNDATTMNTAIMSLYKENKVNPAGGCLPMVVQMPLFIALYSVLNSAIELRQAPFLGWMTDLSAPDLLFNVAGLPVRLLPIVMGLTGFWSQSLTPMDPSQKPTMYIMNVFMLVFFYNLPSGLVLYWTVMNVLTGLQQWLVMRGDGAPAVEVVEVASPAAARRRGRR